MTRNIMHPDKTEFIKGRLSTNNTRRLIALIDYDNTRNLEAAAASLLQAHWKWKWTFSADILVRPNFSQSLWDQQFFVVEPTDIRQLTFFIAVGLLHM